MGKVKGKTVRRLERSSEAIIERCDAIAELAGDPTVRIGAGFAKDHVGVVRSVFTAMLTDIRHQLEAYEGVRPSRLARGASALMNGLGSPDGVQSHPVTSSHILVTGRGGFFEAQTGGIPNAGYICCFGVIEWSAKGGGRLCG